MANQNNAQMNGGLMPVSFETAFGNVSITPDDVVRYLVKGGGNVTEQEIKLFMELCKYQKLNPFVGEAYAIKFGNDFQMVVGYETYKRRAEESPEYAGRKSGIVVLRGDNIVQKEGTCLYPGEKLIGGWCKVYRIRKGEKEETYKEVGLEEYDKKQANWKTKPCTMIEKVAVSQALRAAFPKDYEGLYTAEEVSPVSTKENDDGSVEVIDVDVVDDKPKTITQEQRQHLFEMAQNAFGKETSNEILKEIIASFGLTSTSKMTQEQYEEAIRQVEFAIAKGYGEENS